MSRDDVCFHPSYQKMLRVYGFEEPEKALTYPCHGFTPYATSTTAVSSTSEEAVTVTSPSSNETTTGPTTTVESSTPTASQTDETVVTEMTQTSQTVTIVNSTTSNPIEAEAVNEAFTSLKTDLPSTLLGGTESTTSLGTITTGAVSDPDTHMALSSDQTTVFTTDTIKDSTAGISTPAVLLEAANTVVENRFPSTTPKKAVKVERTTMAAMKSTAKPLQNSSSNVTMTTTNQTSQKIPSNDTKDFTINNLDLKNFTIKLETDFAFPTTDSSSIFDNFFNKTSDLLQPSSNISFMGKGNISSDPILPTLSSFSNFSTIFSGAKPALDKDLNSTSFYSTLVNFIENTTEKLKNFLSPNNSTANPQNTTNASNATSTATQNGQNSTAREEKSMQNNSGTLLSAEKNSINAVKGMAETNDTRNLPKKSISEINQKPNSAAISSPLAFRRAPNYYNIVSLKQSKSISTTYDIKGVKKRHRMKRETQLNANTSEKPQESAGLKDTQSNPASVLLNGQWRTNKNAPTMNIWQFGDNNKTVIETKFHHYTANEKGRNDFYGSLTANNYNSDYRNSNPEYRKAPSLNREYF